MSAKRGGSFLLVVLTFAAAASFVWASTSPALAQESGKRSDSPRSEGQRSEKQRSDNRRGDGPRGDGPRGEGRGPRGDARSPRDFGLPPRGFDSPRGFDQAPRALDLPQEATAKAGFLFIDGEYLQPPYEIRFEDDHVTVNERKLTCIPPPPDYPGYGRGFGGPSRPEQSLRSLVSRLQRELSGNAVVLSFADQPFVQFDNATSSDLLRAMISSDGRAMRQAEVRQRLPDSFDTDLWDQWIENYVAPPDLGRRAAFLLATYDEKQREAEAQIRARRWLEALIYPLEVSGMVLSVVALGHLLGGRPHAGRPTRGLDPSPALIQALNWSLFFTATFSLLDLAWTIVTVRTDETRELNPIGSQLIHDPLRLVAFKVGVTFACLALIWVLRRHKRAQIAAWWICLVLTLVTCRWLMVNALLHSAM